MLPGWRRPFALAAAFVLVIPLAGGLAFPRASDIEKKELRTPAPAPDFSLRGSHWLALPHRLDAYLADRFGLRREMIRLYSNVTRRMLREGNANVLVGAHGRMFLRMNDAVAQSAGQVRRDRRVADTVDFLVSMRQALAARGIRFLVAPPPNAATVYPEDLPWWWRNRGLPTEYDLVAGALRVRDVDVVDLRPALAGARAAGNLYLYTDSHWSPLGAIIGFNRIVDAGNHPDWRIEPNAALGSPASRRGGDLARMISVDDDVAETSRDLILPPGPKDEAESSYVEEGGAPGGTIMIIGDSFTAEYFAQMLIRRVKRVVWIHHQWCGFDWKWIDRIHPDEVWWMPTERYLLCGEGVRPAGFPGTARAATLDR